MGLPWLGNAQNWSISTIPDSIRKDAHAVIRSNKESFIIDNKLQVKTSVEQVITTTPRRKAFLSIRIFHPSVK